MDDLFRDEGESGKPGVRRKPSRPLIEPRDSERGAGAVAGSNPAVPATLKWDPHPAAGDAIRQLLAVHAGLIEAGNAYAFFELAYTRQTAWMAWLCDRPAEGVPGESGFGGNRKILGSGQGSTPDEACANALAAYRAANPQPEGGK